MTKKNDMSILLEVQKYNHYRILQESYAPKEVKFAITEDKKYVIVDSELFDIEKNENLGLYYESRLLKEEIITESWFETIADIAIGVGSTALAATGVGIAAAQAIDVLHGISFIYRGETRNDEVLRYIGYFSIALALFPLLGNGLKATLITMSKNFVGKPIGSLIKALSKSKIGLSVVKQVKGLISKLGNKVGQLNKWAKEYKWFDAVWSKVGSSFAAGLKSFDDFLGKVIQASGKSGTKALPAAKGTEAVGKLALSSADDIVKAATKMGVTISDDVAKLLPGLVGKNGLTKEMFKKLLSDKNILKLISNTPAFVFKNQKIASMALVGLLKVPKNVLIKNSGQVTKLLGSKPGAILLPQTAKSLNASKALITKNGQELVKVVYMPNKIIKGAGKVRAPKFPITEIPYQMVKANPGIIKSIPSSYKTAAAILAAIGLGSLLTGDSSKPTYVLYDEELVDSIENSGGEIIPTAFDNFNQGNNSAFDNFNQDGEKSKTASVKTTKPIIVRDYDRSWDYKKEGGNYFTKRKVNKNWIKVTPEMKGGRPYQAIKTKVFKD